MLSTHQKIQIARLLSSTVIFIRRAFGRPAEVVATRRGVTWSLNLREGIDLAIYLLGGFEVRTLRRYAQLVREGDVVLDIGANIGAHTLPLAQLVGPGGSVHAFEPTAYAFGKQKENIALNPGLAGRIRSWQLMLTAGDADRLPDSVYSSWPLEDAGDLHQQHSGRLMATQGAAAKSLDSFMKDASVQRVDLIKLDVDGNEADVLAGAANTLRLHKPTIVVELAPYVYERSPQKFDGMLEMLWGLGYSISDMSSGAELPRTARDVRKAIPDGVGINVLARIEPGSS